MTIIYYLVGILLITNLITIIALFDLKKEYKDNREVNELINELWKNNNSQMDRIYDVHTDIYEQYKNMLESYKLIKSIHEKIYEEYKTLKEQYQDILSNNAELLVYGESIENRYSDCYEQFNNLNDKINEVLTALNNNSAE